MYLSSISSRLVLHDVHNWSVKHAYGNYDSGIRDISWSDDGKYILQVNPKGLIEILSVTDSEVKSLQHVPTKDTWAAAFHRDGHRHIAVGSKDGNVSIWDTKLKTIFKTFPAPQQSSMVNHLSYNCKNTNLAASLQNGDTIIYGLTTNMPLHTLKVTGSNSISAMKFHPESWSLLGLATDEGHLLLKDIMTTKDRAFFKNDHSSPVTGFTFSQIHRDVILSVGLDKLVHIYDVRMEHKVSNIRTAYPLTAIDMNLENRIALGSKKGYVMLYDLRDYSSPICVLNDHSQDVRCVVFQPIRKKYLSAEGSIKEESVKISPKFKSANPNLPDIFEMCTSPPGRDESHSTINGSKADSFLMMMGLDNTSNSSHQQDIDTFKSPIQGHGDASDLKVTNQWSERKSMAKSSTPLVSKVDLSVNGDCDKNNVITHVYENNLQPEKFKEINGSHESPSSGLVNEMKEFLEISLADIAEENRKCYLNVMLMLAKQRLFLEDELNTLKGKLEILQKSQNSLLEENKRLIIEVEFLKANKK